MVVIAVDLRCLKKKKKKKGFTHSDRTFLCPLHGLFCALRLHARAEARWCGSGKSRQGPEAAGSPLSPGSAVPRTPSLRTEGVAAAAAAAAAAVAAVGGLLIPELTCRRRSMGGGAPVGGDGDGDGGGGGRWGGRRGAGPGAGLEESFTFCASPLCHCFWRCCPCGCWGCC